MPKPKKKQKQNQRKSKSKEKEKAKAKALDATGCCMHALHAAKRMHGHSMHTAPV